MTIQIGPVPQSFLTGKNKMTQKVNKWANKLHRSQPNHSLPAQSRRSIEQAPWGTRTRLENPTEKMRIRLPSTKLQTGLWTRCKKGAKSHRAGSCLLLFDLLLWAVSRGMGISLFEKPKELASGCYSLIYRAPKRRESWPTNKER